VAEEHKVLPLNELDEALNPIRMTKPGVGKK
jgi:hypothetical protein